jgi:predicted nucleic acid-binding protein
MASDRIVIDSGALTAIAKKGAPGEAVRVALRRALERAGHVLVPTVVIAESTTGQGSRDALVNRFLANANVADLNERIARSAAIIRTATRRSSVIDAIVVATADAEPNSVILTGDAGDIGRLAAVRNRSRVFPI